MEMAAVVSGVRLVLDLSYSFYMARRVYGWQPPASALLQVDTHIQPFKFKNHRSVFADYPMFFWGHQAPRYLGLFYREFFGLSSVFYYKEDTDIRPPDLEFSLKSKRWNSYLLLKDYFHLVNEGPV